VVVSIGLLSSVAVNAYLLSELSSDLPQDLMYRVDTRALSLEDHSPVTTSHVNLGLGFPIDVLEQVCNWPLEVGP